jgi:DNA processing protein
MSDTNVTDDAAAREEESRVTSDVTARVGIDVDDLSALTVLEGIRNFGPQKFKELHLAGVRPTDALRTPARLPIKGKRGEEFKAAIARLGEPDLALARRRAVRQIIRADENDAHILTYNSAEYPRNVYCSNNPIPVLYVRGSLAALTQTHAVACVGSRNIREPYRALHRAFAETAVANSFAIVSGFATGADRVGHEAALETSGQTVLVMPCGLDRPFPPENKELWQEFLRYPDAAMVSEFHFGTKAAALTLRKRNKLIVAFALGVLLSQTSARGGAMNAYRFASEQHKPVATFEPDGTPDTSGNAEIAGRANHNAHALLSPDAAASATTFSVQQHTPAHWRQWLQRLSSST